MARIEPPLGYEHLRQTPDDWKRYEILEGELVVTASPDARHQEIVGNLFGCCDKLSNMDTEGLTLRRSTLYCMRPGIEIDVADVFA